MKKNVKFPVLTAMAGSLWLCACVADPNSPGVEYMPDMYRSPSVEAYVDYGEVEGIYDEEAQKLIAEKFSFTPPAGTIPYYGTGGSSGAMMPYKHGAWVNADKTHGLYGVMQDSAGRLNADADINPVAWSAEVEKEGQVLYQAFCIHCHGEKGDGQGSVVTNSGGKFPSPGGYKDTLTMGGIFYTITYGKNAMGSHASQLNKEERWKVAHYVRKLFGKGGGDAAAGADSLVVVPPVDAGLVNE